MADSGPAGVRKIETEAAMGRKKRMLSLGLARHISESKEAALALLEGRRWLMARQPRRALPWFDKALSLDPRCIFAWMDKAVALGGLGRRLEALACINKALRLARKQSAIRRSLERIRAQLKTEGDPRNRPSSTSRRQARRR